MPRGVQGISVESAPRDYTTQRANAGYITPGQTALKFNLDKVSITGALNVPLVTVPAGKALLITDIFMSHDGNVALRFALAIGTLTATNLLTVFSAPVKGDTAPVQQAGIETQLDVPQGATLFVVLPASAGVNAYVNVACFQQNLGAS